MSQSCEGLQVSHVEGRELTDLDTAPDPADSVEIERHTLAQGLTTGTTTVIRDADMMRTGFEARLLDVSTRGVRLVTPQVVAEDEHVQLILRNEIQRLTKRTHGTVRCAIQGDGGRCLVEVELMAQLTPLEVLLLRMTLKSDADLR